MKTEEILNEREKTHGDFEVITQLILRFKESVLSFRRNIPRASQELALDMIFLKIARIVCGDPNHADHWDDIAGYAMLGKGKEETIGDKADRMVGEILENLEESKKYFDDNNGVRHSIPCSCFECCWIPKCSACKLILPPKPDYCYFNGEPVHTACYKALKEAEGPKEELKEECEHEWSVIPICKKCGAILYGFANP